MMAGKKFYARCALVAVAALPWLIRWPVRVGAQKEIRVLQQEADQLSQLRAEHERLSRLAAQAEEAHAKSTKAVTEVPRLRENVNQLQQQTNALTKVAAENLETTRALVDLAKSPVGKKFERDAWGYNGYDTPEHTMQSFVSAAQSRNWPGLFDSVTPAWKTWLEQQLKESNQTMAEGMDEFTREIKEYHFTDGRPISDDLIVLYTWFDYFKEQDGKSGYGAPLYFKRIDGQWKLDDPQAYEDK